jgi:hypothetical protein
MPFAYLLPASAVAAAETLQRHGFVVETLREDIELELAIPRRASPNRATAPKDVAPTNSAPTNSAPTNSAPTNSAPTNSAPTAANDASSRPLALAVTWRGERRRVDAGTILVRGATPLAPLLAQLLEPESDVGFAAWRLLDAPVGEDWPVCRLLEHAPLLTATKRPPPERRAAPQRVTFDLWQRGAVNLHGDIFPACQWLDEEHYLQRREGRLWRIHAATGRWSAFPANVEPLLKSIASLPGIGGDRPQCRLAAERGPHGVPLRVLERPVLRAAGWLAVGPADHDAATRGIGDVQSRWPLRRFRPRFECFRDRCGDRE